MNKEKVFIVILGQCKNALTDKLEAQTECKVVEASADVSRPLEMIEKTVHSTKDIHCEHWLLSHLLCKVIMIKPGKFESLTAHHNQVIDLVNVEESMGLFPHRQYPLQPNGTMVITADETE